LNWGKHCCCCWFGQKWPLNHIKNDSRIFEHPQVYSSLDSKRYLGKRNLCACFVPHSLTPEQREDRVTSCQDIIAICNTDKNFFWQNYYRRWDLVFCLWPRNKVTEFWMGWWDISSAEETEIPKVPHKDNVDNFFLLSRHSAQSIHTRGINSKCRFL
jgi:hypothetical protein